MPERIIFTSSQKQRIMDQWGKSSTDVIAEGLGVSRSRISEEAKRLGLPKLKMSALSPLWTAEEVAIMRECIAKDMMPSVIRAKYFPNRSREAVKEKRKRILSGVPMRIDRTPKPRWEKKEGSARPCNLPPACAETFQEKTPKFPPLQYTISECPRVTLEYACHWMQQQKRGWERPEDDREAWRAINAERVHGMFPVPPFLPVKAPKMHDTHRMPPMDRVSQSLGLR